MKEVESIYSILEDKFKFTEYELKSKGNARKPVNMRRIVSLVLLNNTNFTLENIGSIIGRDHSTISHYKDTSENLINTDKSLKKDYDYVENKFNELVYGLDLTTKLKKLLKDKEKIENEILIISEAIEAERKLNFMKQKRHTCV